MSITLNHSDVRVRVAPSPTGDPHVGTAYVALFNHAFARKHNGKMVLRVEDTDQSRARRSSEDEIYQALKWLNLEADEDPIKGGDYGPYRQSERKPIYTEHVQMLEDGGFAYPCFCTSERLDKVRAAQREAKQTTRYDGHCRGLSDEERNRRKGDGESFVVRLNISSLSKGEIEFNDQLRGAVIINAEQLDDQVLLKSDGFPTYHLANVVDDHLMRITHVIRAEEWVSSTPKHVLLYKAFGWAEPEWIHLPLLRNKDKSKISKRKNPVSVNYYKKAGILPEAMVNFLALMGFSLGEDKEIFSRQDFVESLDWKKVSLGGPVFDQEKLNWLNQQYVQELSEERFVHEIREGLFSAEYLKRIYPLVKERLVRFEDFCSQHGFFFNGSLDYSGVDLIPKGMDGNSTKEMLVAISEAFDAIDLWSEESISLALDKVKDSLGLKPRQIFMTVRLVTTGRKDSPPLGPTLEALGKEKVRFRLRDIVQRGLLDQ